MLSIVLAASVFMSLDKRGLVGCELNIASARVYSISANNTINTGECHPQSDFYAGGGPQKAFLVQYKMNTLNMDGFRTSLIGWQGNPVEVGRIAFTGRRLDEPSSATTDPRFFTVLNTSLGQVQIIVSGSEVVLSHNTIISGETAGVVVGTLLPSDFVNGVLELDARVIYNSPNSVGGDNTASIRICTLRGVGNCFYYDIDLPYYETAPEFYMGDALPNNVAGLRARYCKLPAVTQIGTGFSSTCPGPQGAASTGE